MKKVYLLLRNNQETGPYTLTELKQQTLQPTDLIWIEGESASWNHPSFIVDFQTAVTESNKETITPVAEKKDTAFETSPGFQPPIQYHSLQKHRSAVTDGTETDIELIVHRQTSNTVSFAQLLAVALVTTIIVALWKSDFTLIPQVNKNISYAATPVVFQVAPPVNRVQARLQQEAGMAAVQKEPVTALLPAVQKKEKFKKKKTAFPVATTAAITAPPQSLTTPTEQNTVPAASPTTAVAAISEAKAAPATETEAEKSEKRKTLGQALRKLFKKKKKGTDDEVALEQKGS